MIHLHSKKPTYIKLAEEIDFFEYFRKIESRFEHCFLLESLGEVSYTSRYSVIGFDPIERLWAREQILYREKDGKVSEEKVDNPYFRLRDLMPPKVVAREYSGGLVGYLSYEAVNYFESALQVALHPDFPQFEFGVYTDGLVFDKLTGELFYFYFDKSRFSLVEEILHEPLPPPGELTVVFHGDSLSRDEHAEIVRRVREDIRAGKIFQVEVGFKSFYEVTGNTLLAYERLREANPAPFMSYLKFGDRKVLSASPEMLFKLHDGEMETYPLAGTTRRGSSEEEDRLLARTLLNDPKERAEHAMLVDLHRNDIGRVSEFGTVKVRSFMEVKKFAHVQHIASQVVGILKRGEDMFSSLAANFPMGTVSGAPKVESMKIIEQNEGMPRGLYAGGLGHFGFNGDCTFAVNLRCLFLNGTKGYAQTCGGIVYDSEPEAEYEEIQRKLRGMRKTLEVFIR